MPDCPSLTEFEDHLLPRRGDQHRHARDTAVQLGTSFTASFFRPFHPSVLTSFSSASLRRRSQNAPYQIIGYCMSTQTTSSAAQALG